MNEDKKQSFQDWKESYEDKAKRGIEVDWDSGHAYHMTPHDPSECEDEESAYDFDSNYLSEHGPQLFCAPDFLCEHRVTDECYSNEDDEDKVEYIQGFMQQVKENCKLSKEEEDLCMKEIMRLTALKIMKS